jgi:hypothetical protein
VILLVFFLSFFIGFLIYFLSSALSLCTEDQSPGVPRIAPVCVCVCVCCVCAHSRHCVCGVQIDETEERWALLNLSQLAS